MKVLHVIPDQPGHTTEGRCPCDPHTTVSKPLGQQPTVTLTHRHIDQEQQP